MTKITACALKIPVPDLTPASRVGQALPSTCEYALTHHPLEAASSEDRKRYLRIRNNVAGSGGQPTKQTWYVLLSDVAWTLTNET